MFFPKTRSTGTGNTSYSFLTSSLLRRKIGNAGIHSMQTSAGIDFSFAMTNMEFMFTKNFNSKVNNTFKRNAAAIVAPDNAIADDLVYFAQFQFDLSELYVRKFRKRIFEGKAAFSNVTMFKPIHDELQNEFSERNPNAGKETDFGRKKDRLKALHEKVLEEIQELADFCKECKTPKKR